MSGHSKWSTIKRKKAKTDQDRGKAFSKIAKEITVVTKMGGGDPNGNPRLRLAIDKAKEANMPNSNIERAIEKGVGGGEGAHVEELTYEGYGPASTAILVDVMTDNKNRTLGEIQFIFTKSGGNMGKAGSVSWMFKKKGVITFEKGSVAEDKLMEEAVDAGAEDILIEEGIINIETIPENFMTVRDSLKAKGYNPVSSEITMVAENCIKVTGEEAEKVLKLISALEEHDDVQAVHSNFDIPDELIASQQ